ncbi:MAG: hypothetical protein ABJN42_04875 [Roseibium sp.]|uniref:hypothetical protein n=1 Tax=Roseibium sp. TaxID=1936156 RepID=UPI003296FF97
MSVSSAAFRALMKGDVVCRVSNPTVFEFLSDPNSDNIKAIEDDLTRADLMLAMTTDKRGYYATEKSPHKAEMLLRSKCKSLVEDAQNINDFIDFLGLAFPDSEPFACGSPVSAGSISEAVEESSVLSDRLDHLAVAYGRASTTLTRKASKILEKLADLGYLVCINQKMESYIGTALVDYMEDVNEHIVRMIPELEESLEEFDTQNKQVEMFE